MKKNLLYALALACSLGLATSCSDDDTKGGNWNEISKEYTEHVGVGSLTTNGSVKVDATSADKATITLNNIVAGEETVTVSDAALKTTEKGYAFEGSANATTCNIKVTGIIEGDSVNVKIDRTINSDIPEALKLQFVNNPMYPGTAVANVYVNWLDAEGNPNALGSIAGAMVGNLISGKVEAVGINLTKAGAFSCSYKEIGKEEVVMPPSSVAELANGFLTWYEKDNHLVLAVHQDALTILSAVIPEGLDIAPLLQLLPKSGDYYILPIAVKKGDTYTFYLEKDFIMQVLAIVKPLVENNPDFGPIFGQIYPMLESAKTLEFGLVFEK